MRRPALAALLAAAALRAGLAAAEPPGAAPVVSARLEVEAGAAVVDVAVASGWHVNVHDPRDDFLIPTTLAFEAPPGVRVGPVEYPPGVERRLPFAGERPILLYEGAIRLRAPLEGGAETGTPALRAVLRYQACSDTTCLPPATLTLAAGTAPAGGPARAAAGKVGDWIARWGYGLTLAWVVLLGAALNLTPCVYPLISVTVAFFGGRTGDTDARAVVHAVLYVLGICITFSGLGVAAALTGSLFGAALQQPAVLATLALLMVALALGNFGLYHFRMPSGVVRWAGQTGEGGIGALFMGLTMGVVAAPCIGPVVSTLLLYVGARQSAALGFVLFFALGLGMGAPYVVLAVAARRVRRLPRAGAWLATVERLFGVLLLGVALYFASPLLPASWVRFGWALVLAGAGVVLGWSAGGRPAVRAARAAAGVAVVALGLAGLLSAEGGSPIPWQPFSDAALARALAEGRPVLIDFEADWCLPCREMDRTTFRDPAVVRAAQTFATFKVDATGDDDGVAAVLARFRVPGIPTYVLLGPDGSERRRLVGFVPAGEMARALAEAGADRG